MFIPEIASRCASELIAQRLHRVLGDGRAVAGHRAGGKGPGLARHVRQHRRATGSVRSRSIGCAPPAGSSSSSTGRAGIADRAQLVEKRHAAEVEAARLDRALGRGQDGGQHHHLPRRRRQPGLVALQRDAHP